MLLLVLIILEREKPRSETETEFLVSKELQLPVKLIVHVHKYCLRDLILLSTLCQLNTGAWLLWLFLVLLHSC